MLNSIEGLHPMNDAKPTVSVIIATRDRPSVLNQCLQHLRAAVDDSAEIIVVDNSNDAHATLSTIQQHPEVIYLRADPAKRNPAVMRNQGIARSRGAILAFIDDDTLVMAGWYSALIEAFKHPQVGGVVGRVIEEDTPAVNTDVIGRFSPRGELTSNFNNLNEHPVEVEFLHGCNMALRYSALETVGLFDPWFGIYYEEQDIGFRIRNVGYKMIYVKRMCANHLRMPRPPGVPMRSAHSDLRSIFLNCRSLSLLCVSHFGLRSDFMRIALLGLPMHYGKRYIGKRSHKAVTAPLCSFVGSLYGYAMAAYRRTGWYTLPQPRRLGIGYVKS